MTRAKALIPFVPGLVLALAVALAAKAIATWPLVSALGSLFWTLMLGLAIRAMMGTWPRAVAGLQLMAGPALKLAIVFLGFRFSIDHALRHGWSVPVLAAVIVPTTLVFTYCVGRLMGLPRGLAGLVASGHAVCGASAVAATGSVLRSPPANVAAGIAMVTLLGASMTALLPFASTALDLSAETYGAWAGAALHETGQAIAAGFALGETSGDMASLVKLARITFLLPLCLALIWFSGRRNGSGPEKEQLPFPWFVLGFVGSAVAVSTLSIPQPIISAALTATDSLLALSLAGIGLLTDVRGIRGQGLKLAITGFTGTVFVTVLGGLLSIWLFGR